MLFLRELVKGALTLHSSLVSLQVTVVELLLLLVAESSEVVITPEPSARARMQVEV